jgi:carbon-monoxide dehydrogenase medium subunit
VKPARFEYFCPRTVDEAIALLAEHGDDAKVLAGGQSLVPLMNMRLARPAVIIDLNAIAALAYLREQRGMLRFGAMTRQRAAERSALVAERCPLLRDALRLVGHVQIRNRGTIGGSIAHADPAAELTAILAALDGAVTARSVKGTRTIAAQDLFVTYLTTSLDPRELIVEIQVARRHGDFALVGVGVVVTRKGGVIGDVRIALTGVGPTPVRPAAAERLLVGRAPSDGLWSEAAEAVRAAVTPDGDIHASAEYRTHVSGVLAQRALREALSRAKEGA